MTPSNRDCFFTSIALNYLSKALALTTSVFAVHRATRMVIAIVDYRWLSAAQRDRLAAIAQQFSANGSQLEFLDPLTLYERPDLFRYKFNVVEACTSVKPAVAMALLDTAETVTYLDPDTFMYNLLPAHPDANDVWDVQLTPHVLAPAGKDGLISERLFMFYMTFTSATSPCAKKRAVDEVPGMVEAVLRRLRRGRPASASSSTRKLVTCCRASSIVRTCCATPAATWRGGTSSATDAISRTTAVP